jgi:serine/threonine protein kinase
MAADIWALGVLFYKILEGEYPFKLKRSYFGKWVFISSVLKFTDKTSKKNRNLIKSMLMRKPEKRVSLKNILKNWKNI